MKNLLNLLSRRTIIRIVLISILLSELIASGLFVAISWLSRHEININYLIIGAITILCTSLVVTVTLLNYSSRRIRSYELTLSDNEMELNSIFNHSPIMMVLLDNEVKIRMINRLSKPFVFHNDQAVLGVAPGMALRCIHALDSPEGCGFGPICKNCSLRQIIQNTFHYEEVYYRQEIDFYLDKETAEQVNLIVTSIPVRIREKHFILLYIEDATHQKQTELEKVKYAQDLEKSNRELRRFAFISSHDMKEPVRSLVSYTQLLQKKLSTCCNQDDWEMLQFIIQGAHTLESMIDALAKYTELETQELKMKLHKPETLIQKALNCLQVNTNNQKTKIEIPAPLPQLFGDEIQLTALFRMLIENALKFIHPGTSPHLIIRGTTESNETRISVQDNGIGIEPQHHYDIFDFSKRLYPDKFPGIGLGLFLSRKIAERHGGNIWVESQPDKGSVFYFSLPCPR